MHVVGHMVCQYYPTYIESTDTLSIQVAANMTRMQYSTLYLSEMGILNGPASSRVSVGSASR